MDIKVIGIHRVLCSVTDFNDALELMWGTNLAGSDLEHARRETREHFDRLRLIEIEVIPANAEIDWSRVTQPIQGVDRSNWQAPYDEELIDPERGRWAFFLHYVDPEVPLVTPAGRRALPSVTALPGYLAKKKYEAPG